MSEGDPEWIRLYRAALNETDSRKRLTRIEEAERTLKVALRQAIENGDSDQRHVISEALHHLNLLHTILLAKSEKDANRFPMHESHHTSIQIATPGHRSANGASGAALAGMEQTFSLTRILGIIT